MCKRVFVLDQHIKTKINFSLLPPVDLHIAHLARGQINRVSGLIQLLVLPAPDGGPGSLPQGVPDLF